MRGEPVIDMGVIGPVEMLSERRPFAFVLVPRGLLAEMREPRRCGVASEDVERESEEMVRRAGGLSAPGVRGRIESGDMSDPAAFGVSSSSVH